jgi:hypothetical protein
MWLSPTCLPTTDKKESENFQLLNKLIGLEHFEMSSSKYNGNSYLDYNKPKVKRKYVF